MSRPPLDALDVSRIRQIDESMRGHVEELLRSTAAGADRGRLLQLLKGLDSDMHHHFEMEEQGGFLDGALAHDPRLSAMAADLLRQHPMLSHDLKQLITTVENAPAEPAWRATFAEQLHGFINRLVEHERAENRLVQDAYHDDIGEVD